MIQTCVQMRFRVRWRHAGDVFHDLGCFIEHSELMIFSREKFEPRIIAWIGCNLFIQNPDIPEIPPPPRFRVGGEIMVNANAGTEKPASARKDRGVDGFMNAAAVTVCRPIGKQANDVIRYRAGG